ncbi:putative E3 ubiquitin-protein ligase UBR7 isoform X2 [Cynoglossus semilaevis]|uniref:putative E3 ubiquitin-protein ligase UBR7 isoform X2 n=1 Tax=Cynoglossus semilaevis TaxID=244447 RepID=UPI0007DC92C0|nr:putative E3 ubiquitin-protein ligase UBR7 isoform X2 [Cynoglossus semilaevis]
MCEEQTVSLLDVLKEDEELEEEASAVLAGSDSDHCSYPQGYVQRQALYSCHTCISNGSEAAGVCLACSYKCHEGHDLFELYTKRNFRCDCGNTKFKDLQCKLVPDKDEVNTSNKYSHNFSGLYCTCRRPYPDPEDQVEDEMIQCVVCEDWFHGRHLGSLVPDCVGSQEMICESCMNQNPFLWIYADHLAAVDHVTQDAKDVEGRGGHVGIYLPDNRTDVIESTSKRVRGEPEPNCRLEELQKISQNRTRTGAVFWPSTWRSKLCCCSSCQERLSEAQLNFLFDELDTVQAYERRGQNKDQNQGGHDPLMLALDNLNRVQQLEIIHGYNDMKSELKDFLQGFVAEGKVVTPDDIRQFFEQQQSRKRRRVDAGPF